MMTYGVGQARPQWYDRNPSDKSLFYAASGLAPHGVTVRATYTVPTAKKAMVQGGYAMVRRATAAGAVGLARSDLRFGAGNNYLEVGIITNAIGDKDHDSYGSDFLLSAADVVDMTTGDASTTGTVDYLASWKITEFDA